MVETDIAFGMRNMWIRWLVPKVIVFDFDWIFGMFSVPLDVLLFGRLQCYVQLFGLVVVREESYLIRMGLGKILVPPSKELERYIFHVVESVDSLVFWGKCGVPKVKLLPFVPTIVHSSEFFAEQVGVAAEFFGVNTLSTMSKKCLLVVFSTTECAAIAA